MNIVTTFEEWQKIRERLTQKTIGFVPTMGHLHEGHLSLCRRAKQENNVVVVSIFVNPTQFNQSSDYEHYPRTIEQDTQLLATHGVDYLFLPIAREMYPDDYQVQISETELSLELEGQFRPGHFNGMLTIVLKFLNFIQPTQAYFGEKDYQQLLLVKKMVAALFIPTKIIPCKTVRDKNGLALSSRNSRLTAEQKEKATHFPSLLQSSLSCEEITKQLHSLGFKVDYIAEKWGRRLGAVWLDDIRLIDNISLPLNF